MLGPIKKPLPLNVYINAVVAPSQTFKSALPGKFALLPLEEKKNTVNDVGDALCLAHYHATG